MTLRDDIYGYLKKKYNCSPEYLWIRYPGYAVFRHSDNGKWFGIIMNIPFNRLGSGGDDIVEVLNVKVSDPLLADLLIRQEGYFRGYHFGKGGWVSVLLDGTVPFDEICDRLDDSYINTASAAEKKKLRPPKEWVIPANPKHYDIVHAFDSETEIKWKQGAGIKTGDTVYMYVAAPVSAVLYQCTVTGTDIPYQYSKGKVNIKSLMTIRLEKRYPPDLFTFVELHKYGINTVRGPRGIPDTLSDALRNV